MNQRLPWVTQLSMFVLWSGMWIADPAWWRLAAAVVFGLLAFVGGFLVRRDVRRAQRFLESYPAPEGGESAA